MKIMNERKIVIKAPKSLLGYIPRSLSVTTIASWLIYGLNSPPPTESICRSVGEKRRIIERYGTSEPIYQRMIILSLKERQYPLIIKGKPDCIDRIDNPPIITEFRLYSRSSKNSRKNAINIAIIKLQLYMNMLNIPKGKITLLTIEKNDPSQIPFTGVEYYDEVFTPNTKKFRNAIIAALLIRKQKQKRDRSVTKIQKQFIPKLGL